VTLFGDIFREYAPVMKLYYRYIRNFNNAIAAHQRIQNENRRYAEFLQVKKKKKKFVCSEIFDSDFLLILAVVLYDKNRRT
jgi:hypothetical protein